MTGLDEILSSFIPKGYKVEKEVIILKPEEVTATTESGKEINVEDLLIQMALDGIVVNEERAKQGICRCIPTPTGKNLCWSEGIIGALSQDQQQKYCKKITLEKGTKLPEHFEKFVNASKACEKGKTYNSTKIETLEDRLRCMHKLLEE
ncbi:MAG: hypothetical protein QXU98_12775 [Candidatus Parvarchaeota archaeon]